MCIVHIKTQCVHEYSVLCEFYPLDNLPIWMCVIRDDCEYIFLGLCNPDLIQNPGYTNNFYHNNAACPVHFLTFHIYDSLFSTFQETEVNKSVLEELGLT